MKQKLQKGKGEKWSHLHYSTSLSSLTFTSQGKHRPPWSPPLHNSTQNRRRNENHSPDPCWKKGSFGAVSIQPIKCACCLGKGAAALGGLWLVCGVRSYKGSWVRNPFSPSLLFSTHLFRKLKQIKAPKVQLRETEKERKRGRREVGVPFPCFCSNCQQCHAL